MTFIIAAIFGVNIHQTLSYQIATLLFSLLCLSFLSVFVYRQKFRTHRVLPPRGAAGQPLHYSLVVENPGRKITDPVIVIDELASGLPSYDSFINIRDEDDRRRNYFDRILGYPRLVTQIRRNRGGDIPVVNYGSIAAGSSAEIKISMTPLRRGYLRFERTYLGKMDPLGLVRRFHQYRQMDSLLILPRLYNFPALPVHGKRTYQAGGVNQASAVGDSEEFFSLREYRPGDSMRDIHWRSYARTGTPIVKEYQDEYFSRLGLALDTYVSGKPEQVFEEAVSVAASIALSSRQQDSLMDLMFIHDRAYRFTSGRGHAPESMLEVLACVEANPEENIQHLRNLLLQHAADTSAFICVLLDWDEPRRQLVKELQTRGMPVLIFVITTAQAYEAGLHHADIQNVHFLPAGNIQSALDRELSLS